MKKRIWELDVLRGVAVLGMVAVHLIFDMVYIYDMLTLGAGIERIYTFLTEWGGVIFVTLSGICITLGSHPVRRGLIVFATGMVCTLVTWGLCRLDLQGEDIIIRFGVLHCLGVCMLLWPLLKKLPVWVWGILGVAMIVVGLQIQGKVVINAPALMPLGFIYPGFMSADYFPLFPNLGYFLIGAVLGKLVYGKKTSLLPKVNDRFFLIRFFSACGRWSLPIYLLHQPLLTVILELVYSLR